MSGLRKGKVRWDAANRPMSGCRLATANGKSGRRVLTEALHFSVAAAGSSWITPCICTLQ
jgi:hypothetical protein